MKNLRSGAFVALLTLAFTLVISSPTGAQCPQEEEHFDVYCHTACGGPTPGYWCDLPWTDYCCWENGSNCGEAFDCEECQCSPGI